MYWLCMWGHKGGMVNRMLPHHLQGLVDAVPAQKQQMYNQIAFEFTFAYIRNGGLTNESHTKHC